MAPTDLSALLDRFTSVDQDLRAMHEDLVNLLQSNNTHLREVRSGLSRVEEAVGGDPAGSRRTFPWDFSSNVPANTGRNSPTEVRLPINYGGEISRVVIGWTTGTQQAVGARLTTPDGEQIIPRNDPDDAEFIALEDHVIEIPVNFEYEKDDEFIASYINNDTNNDHFVNMILLATEGVQE